MWRGRTSLLVYCLIKPNLVTCKAISPDAPVNNYTLRGQMALMDIELRSW
jgi:hypothetical protein